MGKFDAKRVKKGAKTVCKVGFFTILKSILSSECKFDVTASDAVKAITESNLFSSTKKDMLSELKTSESSDYYKSVISIVKSNAFSSDKLEMMRCLNRK